MLRDEGRMKVGNIREKLRKHRWKEMRLWLAASKNEGKKEGKGETCGGSLKK
jgi:hypothetical protein